MKVIAATKNKGKIREMQEILAPLDIEIVSQQELGLDVDVEETGDTFVKNALIKARAVAMVCDYPILADDSGICVEALGGAPGVRSARYAGDNATDEDRINKLLTELGDNENRRAKFVTSVAFIMPDGTEITAEVAIFHHHSVAFATVPLDGSQSCLSLRRGRPLAVVWWLSFTTTQLLLRQLPSMGAN